MHIQSARLRGVSFAIVMFVVCLLGVSTSHAQEDEEAMLRLRLRVRTFLDEISQGEVDMAVDDLLFSSPLARDEKQITQLKTGIRRSLDRYGRFQRIEPLDTERVGRSIVRCTFLYLCEDYPVVWKLTFYRSTDDQTWNVISLRYGLDFDSLPASP